MIQTTITMTKESKVAAIGQHRNANRKEVVCLDTGTVYTSVTDAAEAIGVTPGAVSIALNTKHAKCHGKRYVFAKDIVEHLGDISASLASKDAEINHLQGMQIDSNHAIHRLQDENEKLRDQIAELEMALDREKETANLFTDLAIKNEESMARLEQEVYYLREELAEYKAREAKRERIKALRAELAELEKEEL